MEDVKIGTCQYCGKEFVRPWGYKNSSEGLHIYKCTLKDIKKRINKHEDDITILMRIENLSTVCSLGAREGNDYWNIMLECKKLKEQLYQEK